MNDTLKLYYAHWNEILSIILRYCISIKIHPTPRCVRERAVVVAVACSMLVKRKRAAMTAATATKQGKFIPYQTNHNFKWKCVSILKVVEAIRNLCNTHSCIADRISWNCVFLLSGMSDLILLQSESQENEQRLIWFQIFNCQIWQKAHTTSYVDMI